MGLINYTFCINIRGFQCLRRLFLSIPEEIQAFPYIVQNQYQYREKHQGPLISRASDLFARMTRDAFCRLRADYDEKGNPVLVGIRSGSDAAVRVEGMSDGTADQLYLALRLASLEQYLENNEPLPFVVDDILLRFDDERALATMDVLAGLADKTQVLFFTHHRHLVELVENAGKPHLKFGVHRL